MKNVSVKRLLIYKNHIFPETRKPLRSITEYLALKNPDLDTLKVRKMKQILDEQEKRRIRHQTNLMNEQINTGLQKYYLQYIRPFQNCPDYYRMLFSYAIKKMEWIDQWKGIKGEEPFFLTRKQVRTILKQLSKEENQEQVDSSKNVQKKDEIPAKITHYSQKRESQRKKLLFEIQRQLYPSQKAQVYSLFTRWYKQFLMKEQSISRQLLSTKIIHLKPFLYGSPVQLYQSKNPQTNLKQCQNQLVDNPQLRQKACNQFAKVIEDRYNEISFIAEKFKVGLAEIRRPLWEQYVQSDKELSFYDLLKFRVR